MIKLPYIKNPTYFKRQQIVALLNVPALLGLAFINLIDFPNWFEIFYLFLMVLYFVFMLVTYHHINKLKRRFQLIIQDRTVKVVNEKNDIIEKGVLIEFENLAVEFDIDWKSNYQKMWRLISGEKVCSHLRIMTKEGVKNLYFWIDSYYQLNQLKSLANITVNYKLKN
jgi:hypothetical protein